MDVDLRGRVQTSVGSLTELSGTKVYPDNRALTFAEFSEMNRPETGIIVKQVAEWYSLKDIQSIKDSYPQPEDNRCGKIVVFSSEPRQEEQYFAVYPEYREFYQGNPALRSICERMRSETLESIPANERESWETHKWIVAVQWSNGSAPLAYDHVQHVHRDSIVASLTMEGSGTIAKVPNEDISKLNYVQIYDEADDMRGHTYQAVPGDLMIINGVHYPGGGLHAAPQNNGSFPSRLTILVSIEK